MKIYTVHLRRQGLDPDRDLVLVREGFSFMAFLFSILWLLWHRLWLAAVIVFAAQMVIAGLVYWLSANEPAILIVDIFTSIVVGLIAHDLQRWKLGQTGYVEQGVVSGRNKDDATRRYLDDHPDVAMAMAGGMTGAAS